MSVIKRRLFLKAAAALVVGAVASAAEPEKKDATLALVVMDPLAAPLACSCVKGYAQRDYDKLAKHLGAKLGKPVTVVFSSTLDSALKKGDGRADIIIGKESVVKAHAAEKKLGAVPVAALTGTDGTTTQTGLVVVAGKDPAVSAADLKGYKVLFGEASAAEKSAAPMALFKDLGVDVPAKPDTCPTCTDGAKAVVEAAKGGEKVAAVISSYAKPLLEGCGTVEKGALKVVGITDPVPFIVAFVNDKLPEATRAEVQKALMAVASDKDLLAALESKGGFVELPGKKK
jgi:ABC-type phosphate/phosphonate transport system substrate-binding protein